MRTEVWLDHDFATRFAAVCGDIPRATYIRRLIEKDVERAENGGKTKTKKRRK